MTVKVSDPNSRHLADVFRALGDPTRLAIYELVRSASPAEGHTEADLRNTVSEIARGFDLTLSTVSHHLKELRRAGLIRCERRGQYVYCSADPRVLDQLGAFAGGAAGAGRGASPSTGTATQA